MSRREAFVVCLVLGILTIVDVIFLITDSPAIFQVIQPLIIAAVAIWLVRRRRHKSTGQ